MSGGSYDYLFYKDPDELLNSLSTIQDMTDRLAGLGYADDAASETEYLLLTIRQFENRISTMKARLEDVWRAVEWWDSNDSGEDGVKKALDAYRNK